MEEFIVLDETYLSEMADLFRRAFRGEPWNDTSANDKDRERKLSNWLMNLGR